MIGRKGARFKAVLPTISFMRRKNTQQNEPKDATISETNDSREEMEDPQSTEEVPRKMTLDYLLGSVPRPEQRLKEGSVQKHGMDGAFHARYIVLTADALFIASSKDADSIKDCIPLLEIVTIKTADLPAGDLKLASCGDEGTASAFEVQTRTTGDCSGLSYIFSAGDEEATRAWAVELEHALRRLHARLEAEQRLSGFVRMQRRVRRVYQARRRRPSARRAYPPASHSAGPVPPPIPPGDCRRRPDPLPEFPGAPASDRAMPAKPRRRLAFFLCSAPCSRGRPRARGDRSAPPPITTRTLSCGPGRMRAPPSRISSPSGDLAGGLAMRRPAETNPIRGSPPTGSPCRAVESVGYSLRFPGRLEPRNTQKKKPRKIARAPAVASCR